MKNILRIIKISKPLHFLVGVIAILVVVGALLELVTPFFFKMAVDEVTLKIGRPERPLDKLIYILVGGFLLAIVGQILSSIANRLGDHFAGRLRKYLTEQFYHKSLTLSQSYFDSEISGRIVNQLNRGLLVITDFFNTATNFILPSFLQAVFTIVVLAYYSIPIAFFVTLLFPIYMYLTSRSTKTWGKYQEKKNILEDVTRGRLSEVIGNIRLVKGFNKQPEEYGFIRENLSEINKIYAKQSARFHIYDFLRNVSLQVVLLIVFLIVFINTFNGATSLGEMVLILQLINQLRRPLFAMSFILTRIQEAESGSKEFFTVLELPTAEPLEKTKTEQIIKSPKIEMQGVTFAYEETREVLKNISLIFEPKDTIALVGKSGAGKSTLINLVMKFYPVTKGEIFLGGLSYKKLSHAEIRENIALVFQESELFSTSIAENVAYGKLGATEAEIKHALKLASALEFVEKLPNGIHSAVGERGVKLSGGQKQRIQIARAILKDAPILILDEATSSLDAQSELAVQEALNHMMKNKLVIIIAHRFSTLQNANKIVVLNEGEIVDAGSPAELAKKPGIYADLLRFQVEGNKKLLESYEIF